jgi:hypothetical protein
MPNPGTPEPDPYVDAADPIALKPETYARHARAVDYVERTNRARYPRAGRGRTTNPNAGIWASLPSGTSISAASGMNLGSGTVTLCSRSGTTLTADGESVTVCNAGDIITATGSDKAVKLSWSDGVWACSRCN